ncbi:MAG TPA: hypothetical protein ENN41_03750 [Sediminispirochaeta sp.]|nr:hypothetical protein [Sediminispirochaeta sp.]
MDRSLKSGCWYRIELQFAKVFIAEYRSEGQISAHGRFVFPDGSSKDADSILPYVDSLIEIEAPDLSQELDIGDFINE